MHPTMSVAEIDALIAELKSVRHMRLTGRQVAESAYSGRMVKFSAATIEEISAEIARLEIERGRLTGCSRIGPLRVGFGPY